MPENMSLAVFDPLKAINADIIAKDAVQEFDYETPEGIERVRSWCHRLRGHKGDIERCRIASKEGAAKYVKQVNQVAKDLTEEVQTIHDVRMKPIKDIEAKNRADAEAIVAAEEKVKAEKAAAEQKELEEFRAQAQAQQEKEAVEKAEKEQAAREKRIAEEAAEQARIDAAEAIKKAEEDTRLAKVKAEEERIARAIAESAAKHKAEQEKKDAIVKAEREKQEAIEAVKEKARIKASNEAFRKETAARAEAERVADVEHQKEVEKEIFNWFITRTYFSTMPDGNGIVTKLVENIKAGKIPNVTINY